MPTKKAKKKDKVYDPIWEKESYAPVIQPDEEGSKIHLFCGTEKHEHSVSFGTKHIVFTCSVCGIDKSLESPEINKSVANLRIIHKCFLQIKDEFIDGYEQYAKKKLSEVEKKGKKE